jgi:hypothetical protein
VISVTINFDDVVPCASPPIDGQIALAGIVSVNTQNGNDSTAEIVATNPAPVIPPGTAMVTFYVMGGQGGEVHNIGVRVTDAETEAQYEGQVVLTIIPWP